MSLWRHMTRGLRVLSNRTAADRDVADEVDDYLEQATAAYVADGLSPEDARRAARRELGNATAVREQVRTYGWENTLETLAADVIYGARRLRRSPGFTVVSVLTLALGTGATTAIFSAVNAVILQSLPYPDPHRIITIWDTGTDGSRLDVTFGTYRELAQRARSFEALAVMRPWTPTIIGTGEPERLDAQRVTAEYFRVLGVSPRLGRDFEASEDRMNGPKVVILSNALWERRFGGDTTIVGRHIVLDDVAYTVVGILPGGFENVLAPDAQLWSPLQYDVALPPDGREWGHHLRMAARLRRGVGLEQARQELATIARDALPDFFRPTWASLSNGFFVSSLQDDVTRAVKPALVAVGGAVMLVLVIACVNVTNLLLARGVQRRGEFAMRVALGAARTRLIRQLLTESLLLAGLGGGVGLLIASAGVGTLVALSPSDLPRASAIRVDSAVFAFTLGITVLIGVLVGLLPALHASRGDLHAGLQQSSRRLAGGHQFTRRALVIAQVAVAVVLLVSAGLLFRSLQRLFAIDPGFDAANVLTMQVQTSGTRFDNPTTHRFFAEALESVRRVPGVATAAFVTQLPLSGEYEMYGVHLESIASERADENRAAYRYAVTSGYFETLRIPLRRGRFVDDHDGAGMPLAAVISESLAKRRFPGQDPIGQRVHVGMDTGPWYTIVGIAGDVKQMSLAVGQADAVYLTAPQWHFADRARWLVVRAHGDSARLVPALKQAIWAVDKDRPIVRVTAMDDLVAASAAERRFALILFEAFALVALLLAGTGLYGVLSGSVTERMREIGVRSALGATRTAIVALVVRQGMALTGVGIVAGLVGAVAASGALSTLLFDISRRDPLTYGSVVAVLLGVSAVACSVPAWRAARVDPTITLRTD